MRKLSDAFIEFIEPALEIFGNPLPRTTEHAAACAIGHVVWNAVVMEELNPGTDHITPAKRHGGEVPEINQIIDRMAERKRKLFANDNRIIGVYDVVKKPNGTYSIWTQIVDTNQLN